MITIFTIPKPFSDEHIELIQKNAIQSWLTVTEALHINLCGDEDGIKRYATLFGVNHIDEIKKNKYGTPLLDDVFKKVNERAKTDLLCYVNCDIILTKDILKALAKIQERFKKFLVVGRRIDLDINHSLKYTAGWEDSLMTIASGKGKIHGFSGVDYFIFPKTILKQIPPFAVGRIGWDNWIIYHARNKGYPVVDITDAYKVIHQNHKYTHLHNGFKQRNDGEEARQNLKFAGGRRRMYTIRDAEYILNKDGIKKNSNIIYSIFRFLIEKSPLYLLYGPYISIRRKLQGISK